MFETSASSLLFYSYHPRTIPIPISHFPQTFHVFIPTSSPSPPLRISIIPASTFSGSTSIILIRSYPLCPPSHPHPYLCPCPLPSHPPILIPILIPIPISFPIHHISSIYCMSSCHVIMSVSYCHTHMSSCHVSTCHVIVSYHIHYQYQFTFVT